MDLIASSSSSDSDEEYVLVRRIKNYRPRVNYLEMYDDKDFFYRFRVTKDTFVALVETIENSIAPATNRGGSIKPIFQVLLTLRFYALGCMQRAAADFVGVSVSSACRIIKRVSYSIATLRGRYINMPETNIELERMAAKFYQIARFPRVIGAIDCTLVPIESPGGEDAEIFRSRKNFFAINVQTVADLDLKIRDIVARWPGSSHDQTIFNNSRLKYRFKEGQFGRYLLVGDSGYGLKPYLMTKFHETHTVTQNLFNESLIRTRCTVERQYGVWKRRFPVLKLGMRLKLENILNVIVATAVIHNMAIEKNEEIPEEWFVEENEEDNLEPLQQNNIPARDARDLLILNHFANL